MLEITNITKTFNPDTVNAKLALDNLSLSVKDGDFISIIGANGAGKSTLFNAIAGDFITDTGSIVLDGEDITLTPSHKRAKVIGRLFQDPMRGSAPGMSIEENLALAAGKGGWLSKINKKDKEEFRQRLSLLNMGLEDRMHQPVGLLSGGQRQPSFALSSPSTSKITVPLSIITVLFPRSRADCILCVIIRQVRWFSSTIFVVSSSTFSAVEGSRAAVCSSSSNSFGGVYVAIISVNACL